MILALAVLCFVLSAIPAVMTWRNWRRFHQAPAADAGSSPRVSVLIPARNEAARIDATLRALLASRDVELQILVWDDASTDDTADCVERIAGNDARVRLLRGAGPPADWNGKQYACWRLALAADYDELLFLDADVVIEPDAVSRAVSYRRRLGIDLLSGFPRELTGSWGEGLLIPLIHFILLAFLPFERMRRTNSPAAAAGCGQFFVAARDAYFVAGGHAAIAGSLHDGIELPRSFRRAGRSTDLFDAGDVASCRMYHSFRETWRGLAKNAVEGAGRPDLIAPVTLLLFFGQTAPVGVAAWAYLADAATPTLAVAAAAVVLSYLPRWLLALRFGQSLLGAALHPIGVLLFIGIQWNGWFCWLLGVGPQWKDRTYVSPLPRASE